MAQTCVSMIKCYVLLNCLNYKRILNTGTLSWCNNMTTEFLFPQEPIRLSIEIANEILIHCVKLGASDITFQTNEPIFAEMYGRLNKITRRRLSNTEVGEIINAIYGQ